VGALVVPGDLAAPACFAVAGHPAFADAAPDDAAERVVLDRGGVVARASVVAAGAVLGPDVLGGVPGGAGDQGGVGWLG